MLESKREDSTKVEISEIGPVKQHHIETIGKSSIEDGQPEGNIAISREHSLTIYFDRIEYIFDILYFSAFGDVGVG